MAIGLVCFIIPAVSYDGPCLIDGGPSPCKWSPTLCECDVKIFDPNTVQGKGRHNYNDSVSIVRRFDSPKIQLKLKLALTLTLTLTDTGDLRTIEQTPISYIIAHLISYLWPIRTQQHFLTLIFISNQFNFFSQTWNRLCSSVTGGAVNKMSSAYI